MSEEQREAHRKKNREWMRLWRLRNPEKARSRARENYKKHKAKRVAKIGEWKRADRERVRASNSRSEA